MLSFEGQKIQGAQNIVAKLTSLPFRQCQHSITTVDCLPSGVGTDMLVFISDNLHLTTEQRTLNFSQDGIFLPYENMLNYDSFAVRLSEEEIPNLIKILRGFNEIEIKFKLENIKKIWQRFLHRDSVFLEAERQKSPFGHVDDWAIEFLKLTEDDATLMQAGICSS